jgi:hypothetical protein
MTRKKTTVYIDEELLRAAKVRAARTGKKDYEVFEEGLRRVLGLDIFERAWARNTLSEDEALKLAYEEIHEMRRERREPEGSAP